MEGYLHSYIIDVTVKRAESTSHDYIDGHDERFLVCIK
jgi:hypothetical protein